VDVETNTEKNKEAQNQSAAAATAASNSNSELPETYLQFLAKHNISNKRAAKKNKNVGVSIPSRNEEKKGVPNGSKKRNIESTKGTEKKPAKRNNAKLTSTSKGLSQPEMDMLANAADKASSWAWDDERVPSESDPYRYAPQPPMHHPPEYPYYNYVYPPRYYGYRGYRPPPYPHPYGYPPVPPPPPNVRASAPMKSLGASSSSPYSWNIEDDTALLSIIKKNKHVKNYDWDWDEIAKELNRGKRLVGCVNN
jgi:hypothetical protein